MLWLARYFPGLNLSFDDVDQMTVAATNSMRRAGRKILDREEAMRFEHTKIVAQAAGMKVI